VRTAANLQLKPGQLDPQAAQAQAILERIIVDRDRSDRRRGEPAARLALIGSSVRVQELFGVRRYSA